MGNRLPDQLRVIPDNFDLKKPSQMLRLFYEPLYFICINSLFQADLEDIHKGAFRSLQNIKLCRSSRQALDHIHKSHPNRLYRLIITQEMGVHVFMQLQTISTINHIYVLHNNLTYLQSLKNNGFGKVKIRCSNEDQFLQKIFEYHVVDNKLRRPRRFIKSSMSQIQVSKQESMLIKFIKLENKQQAKKDFINLALYMCNPESSEIMTFQQNYKIQSNQNIDPKQILKWYTKHNFYSFLLNGIIRNSYDLSQVGYIRLPFHDLFHSIKQLYQIQKKNNLIQVYKAVRLQEDEFRLIQNSLGKQIQTIQFFTATKNLSQTHMVQEKNTLFVINIKNNQKVFPYDFGFGDISTIGYSDDQEIIFNPLNKFFVQKIDTSKPIKKIYLKYGESSQQSSSNNPILITSNSDFKIRKNKKEQTKKKQDNIKKNSSPQDSTKKKQNGQLILIQNRNNQYNQRQISSNKSLRGEDDLPLRTNKNQQSTPIKIQNSNSNQQEIQNQQDHFNQKLKILNNQIQSDSPYRSNIVSRLSSRRQSRRQSRKEDLLKKHPSNQQQIKSKLQSPSKQIRRQIRDVNYNQQEGFIQSVVSIVKKQNQKKQLTPTKKQSRSKQIQKFPSHIQKTPNNQGSTAYDVITSGISQSRSNKFRSMSRNLQQSSQRTPLTHNPNSQDTQDYFMLTKVHHLYNRLNVYNRYIWLDPKINQTEPRINLSSFNQFYLTKPCQSVRQVIQVISKHPNQNYCIICSLGIGQQLCKQVKDYKNVIHIYIFTAYVSKGEPLKAKWTKIRGLCSTLNDLVTKITRQVKFTANKSFPKFIRTNMEKSNIWNLYSLYGLLGMRNKVRAKQDFVKLASYLFGHQQATITKFINQYQSERGDNGEIQKNIEWYLGLNTSSSNFVRRILDTLLKHSNDIMQLGYIRLPFFNLVSAIKMVHKKQKFEQMQVYRTDKLVETQLKFMKQNTGKLVRLLGFLTGYKTKKKAQKYSNNNSYNTFIIIKIKDRQRAQEDDFGYIDTTKIKFSKNHTPDQQIIFNAFNVFKIQKVQIPSPAQTNTLGTPAVIILKYGQLCEIFQKKINKLKLHKNQQAEIINYKLQQKALKKYMCNQGDVLYHTQRYDQAIRYRKKLFQAYKLQGIPQSKEAAQIYHQIGICYKQKGQFDKAFDYYLEALRIFKKTIGKTHELTANCYSNIAEIYKQKKKTEEALKYYLKGIQSYLNAYGNQELFLTNSYNSIASIYFLRGQHQKALQFYNKSLKLFELNSKQSAEHANCLSAIGLVYKSMGDFNPCLQNLFQSLKIRLILFGQNNPDVINIYVKIAQVYKQKQQIQKSLQYYKTSLGIAFQVYGKTHLQVAKIHNSLGLIYKQKEEYQNALQSSKDALKIYIEIKGKNQIDTAVVFNNIGQIYRMKNQYQKALENLFEAQKIFTEKLTLKCIQNGTTFNNIGSVYYSKGDLQKAFQYFQKSLQIRLSCLNQKHPDVATSLNNIGEIYKSRGNNDKALQYFNKSLQIRLETLGNQHIQTAISYNNLGQVYRARQQLDLSLQYYLKALMILKNTFGKNHQSVLQSYNNIGLIWRQKGFLDKALKYQVKSFQLRVLTYGLNDLSNATSYNNIGIIYYLKGQLDKALDYYFNCLKIQIDTCGEEHSSVATSYNNIGQVYKQKKLYPKALQYYSKALVIAKNNFGDNNLLTATCYNNIGSVYHLNGELDKGLEYYMKSFQIQKDKFGENHSSTATSYGNIGLIWKQKGQKQKAFQCYNKSLKIYLNIFGQNHRATASIYFNLGKLYKILPNVAKSFDCFNKCYQIRKKILGQNNAETQICLSQIKELQRTSPQPPKISTNPRGIERSNSYVGQKFERRLSDRKYSRKNLQKKNQNKWSVDRLVAMKMRK